MWENLFKHIDIPPQARSSGTQAGCWAYLADLLPWPQNVHILDGMAEDLQAECDSVRARGLACLPARL